MHTLRSCEKKVGLSLSEVWKLFAYIIYSWLEVIQGYRFSSHHIVSRILVADHDLLDHTVFLIYLSI